MSNDFMQRRFLLNKAGLGLPRTAANPKPNQVNPQPATKPAPPPKKPGCSACSRRKSS